MSKSKQLGKAWPEYFSAPQKNNDAVAPVEQKSNRCEYELFVEKYLGLKEHDFFGKHVLINFDTLVDMALAAHQQFSNIPYEK